MHHILAFAVAITAVLTKCELGILSGLHTTWLLTSLPHITPMGCSVIKTLLYTITLRQNNHISNSSQALLYSSSTLEAPHHTRLGMFHFCTCTNTLDTFTTNLWWANTSSWFQCEHVLLSVFLVLGRPFLFSCKMKRQFINASQKDEQYIQVVIMNYTHCTWNILRIGIQWKEENSNRVTRWKI